jgi:hypothetical protein
MGMIYQRGKVYWIKYYRNGKPYRESSKSKKEADAKRLLKKREGEIGNGKLPGIYFDRVRFGELAEDFKVDRELKGGKQSKADAEKRLKNLARHFDGMRGTQITTTQIKRYIKLRLMRVRPMRPSTGNWLPSDVCSI